MCSGSTQAIDRRAVSWNQYVLHSRHMKHPYLDGIRTRRDVLLRRELRNGMNIRQPCYICPFCGFQTPFLVQHWLTHATRRLPPRSCDVVPGEQQRSATHTCTQECHEERQARAGCSHPFVKHLSRLFWKAVLRCTAEFLPDRNHTVRVTVASAFSACNSWPGTRRIASDPAYSLPMRLVSNGCMFKGEVSEGWHPSDIDKLYKRHKGDMTALRADPKYSTIRSVHSCRRGLASVTHYWHTAIADLQRADHQGSPHRATKAKAWLRVAHLADRRLSVRELKLIASQLSAQLPISLSRRTGSMRPTSAAICG